MEKRTSKALKWKKRHKLINVQGTIFANHQISPLAVIFAIANHCMYRIMFCIDTLIISAGCYTVHCCNTCHGAVGSFTVESLITG